MTPDRIFGLRIDRLRSGLILHRYGPRFLADRNLHVVGLGVRTRYSCTGELNSIAISALTPAGVYRAGALASAVCFAKELAENQ